MFEFLARFFSSGGPFMWVILLIFASALAVIVERLVFYLRSCRGDATAIVDSASEALSRDDVEKAKAIVSQRSGPLNRILGAAIESYRYSPTYKEVRQDVEETAIRELPRLSRRLNYLAMFANISTLVGLLGTIFGLQRSFSSLAVAEASQKAAMLAAGISQAMNTTAFGLIVAVPCLIAFAKLTNMQTGLIEELDSSSLRLLHFIEKKMASDGWREEKSDIGQRTDQDGGEESLSAV